MLIVILERRIEIMRNVTVGRRRSNCQKISPSKESQERCVGINNGLIDEVVAKSVNSRQYKKDEVKKSKDTHVS